MGTWSLHLDTVLARLLSNLKLPGLLVILGTGFNYMNSLASFLDFTL